MVLVRSLLAILETLLAMAVTIALAVWLNRWGYLLLASLVAPLLLLRTELSMELGISFFQPPVNWARNLSRRLYWLAEHRDAGIFYFITDPIVCTSLLAPDALYHCFVLCWSVLVKVIATIIATCKHPMQSIWA
jgi:hypothetical protein